MIPSADADGTDSDPRADLAASDRYDQNANQPN